MSQGRWVASSELDVQPQVSEQGRGASYAHAERGLDRKFLRKGSLTHAEIVMGTSQQLNSKGETLDMKAGRDVITPRPVAVRANMNFGGGGQPVVTVHHHGARVISRPPPAPSAPFNNLSPRTQHATSYRDAALAAAQHGLSAYAPSATAAAAAAAARGHTSRSGGGTSGAGGAAPGRPPPAPRPVQHSAPTPMTPTSNGAAAAAAAADLLPSCGGASPSRSSMAFSRSSVFLPSRGSVPSPGSPGRGADVSAAASTPGANHRPGDVATVTVTYNDIWWRGAFDGSVEPDDPLLGSGGGSSAPRPLSGTFSAIRVMSPGWGTASPSACEADGRPGTRGGGPQFDIDGRPTTRGGQRPPSRVQMTFAQHRPHLHVTPMGGHGWAGLFAGGGMGLGEAPALPPAPYTSSPRAPSAGASMSWSGDAAETQAALRRQLVPLSPSVAGGAASAAAVAAARLSSPPARIFGSGSSTGPGAFGGVLSSLAPPLGSSLGPPSANHSPQGLQAPGPSPPLLGAPGGGSSVISSCSGSGGGGGGGARTQLAPKLSSIAEAPAGSSVLLPLPPQQLQPPPPPPPKGPMGWADGGSGTGRKAPREREASFTSLPGELDALQSRLPNAISEEDQVDELSCRASVDLDAGGGGRGGSGRARLRRSSSSTAVGAATGVYACGHMSPAGDLTATLQGPQGGLGLQTDETPSTRPRR